MGYQAVCQRFVCVDSGNILEWRVVKSTQIRTRTQRDRHKYEHSKHTFVHMYTQHTHTGIEATNWLKILVEHIVTRIGLLCCVLMINREHALLKTKMHQLRMDTGRICDGSVNFLWTFLAIAHHRRFVCCIRPKLIQFLVLTGCLPQCCVVL